MGTGGASVESDSPFSDVLAANERYAAIYESGRLQGRARRGLAILTCMDSRIDPLAMLGLAPGDAKILRNAGARVSDDVLRTLVLASYLLGVDRVMIVAHTDCRMTIGDESEVHAAIAAAGGPDTRSLSFLTTKDVRESLAIDVQKVRSFPYLGELAIGGFLYDLSSGRLEPIVD
jgi:carbonic anhydrase